MNTTIKDFNFKSRQTGIKLFTALYIQLHNSGYDEAADCIHKIVQDMLFDNIGLDIAKNKVVKICNNYEIER